MLWLALAACDRDYDGPAPLGEAAAFGRVKSVLGANLADVTVCAHELEVPCVVTEGDGEFLLDGLPEDTDVIVTMTREDNLPTAFLFHTSLTEAWEKTLMPMSLVDGMAERVDTTLDPELGHALFILWSEPSYQSDRVEGVAFTVSPAAEVTYYQGSGVYPDPDATATTSSGAGGAFNLTPGDYTFAFDDPRGVCQPWFTFAHDAGEPVPVRVIAGFSSYMDLVCP